MRPIEGRPSSLHSSPSAGPPRTGWLLSALFCPTVLVGCCQEAWESSKNSGMTAYPRHLLGLRSESSADMQRCLRKGPMSFASLRQLVSLLHRGRRDWSRSRPSIALRTATARSCATRGLTVQAGACLAASGVLDGLSPKACRVCAFPSWSQDGKIVAFHHKTLPAVVV